ncbi:hypothetical protein EKO04_003960 [Ascochyta lentis]|uniref:Thioesterase domain-containing protein n=1 Tax=Ascochyta lentis TaxID=205686 RepID=A0A8H7J6S8_9PLEO|nr:hypothetical protein EKO04_003960 [Ascochyta lentis]
MHISNPVKIQDALPTHARSPPVFLIHDAGGTVFSYFTLGRLGPRVYGIYDPQFEQLGNGGWQSILEMAEAYIRLMRKVVVRGSIILGGWSFGGMLAVQISHLLSLNGRGLKVERIILIDSIYSTRARKSANEAHAPSLLGVSEDVKDKVLTSLMRATRLSDEWTPPVWGTNGSSSKIKPMPPPVILIKAMERIAMENLEDECILDFTRELPDLGWSDMHQGFVSYVVQTPGNHYSLFDDDYMLSTTANVTKALNIDIRGPIGSLVSCVGFGFVQTFRQALIVRAIEGAVNGNTAVIRTMVSEVVDDERYKPRAFLLMPIAFNIAVILGPILAFFVAAVTNGYADTEKPRGTSSASNGRYPFAPPALFNGAILLTALLLVLFRLKEEDPALKIARKLTGLFLGAKKERYTDVGYQNLHEEDGEEMMPWRCDPFEDQSTGVGRDALLVKPVPTVLPLRRMFTWNLCLTIASQAILEGHVGAYNTLWPSFLSASVVDDGKVRSFWSFSGGLGMSIRDVARSLVILGIVGLPLQVFGYPRAVQRFRILGLWRVFLLGFPLAYALTPLLAVLPSDSPLPAPRDGAIVWSMIIFVQSLVIVSGSFVLPAQLTLTNNCPG